MEELMLVQFKRSDKAFLQYLPRNMWPLVETEHAICVGVIFRGQACGAALAELALDQEWYLRYIFVDPQARLCGVGTYLLRGLLGQVQKAGAGCLRAVWSVGMLQDGRTELTLLKRAGFSSSKPISTAFSTCLGDIPVLNIQLPPEMVIYDAYSLPDSQIQAINALTLQHALPPFANIRLLHDPDGTLCSFCVVNGELSGILLIDRRDDGLTVSGLYVFEAFRKGRTAAALLSHTIQLAKKIYPPDTMVTASAINQDSFAFCDKLLRRGNDRSKETEFSSVFTFERRAI